MGRWISEDPIGFEAGDANLQRYVGNWSTGGTDPSGRLLHVVIGGAIGAVGGAIVGGMSDPDGGLDGIVIGFVSGGVGGAVTAGTFGAAAAVISAGGAGTVITGVGAGAVSGAAGGFSSSLTEEVLELAVGDPFDVNELGRDAMVSACVGVVGGCVIGVGSAAAGATADDLISMPLHLRGLIGGNTSIWIRNGQIISEEFLGDR